MPLEQVRKLQGQIQTKSQTGSGFGAQKRRPPLKKKEVLFLRYYSNYLLLIGEERAIHKLIYWKKLFPEVERCQKRKIFYLQLAMVAVLT